MIRAISARERQILEGFADPGSAINPGAAAPLFDQLMRVEGVYGDMASHYDYRVLPPFDPVGQGGPLPVEGSVTRAGECAVRGCSLQIVTLSLRRLAPSGGVSSCAERSSSIGPLRCPTARST